ncbi:hypothetical protein JCM10212_007047 [Sporobolomyces blumeae]
MYSRNLVLQDPYSSRVTTTSSHPQLRDLLVFTPAAQPSASSSKAPAVDNSITTVTYDSLASHCLYSSRTPEYTPLSFSPCCITSGCGLVAAGGQNSELAIRSAQVGVEWCEQIIPRASTSSSSRVHSAIGSINNSLDLSPSPANPSLPRLLVSSNDEVIKVYDVVGRPPDWRGAARRRARERKNGVSLVEATWEAERRIKRKRIEEPTSGKNRDDDGEEDDEDEQVEEIPSYDAGGRCTVIPRVEFDIHFATPINHCSVSPDGTKLVAVGDTNEVFLFDVRPNGEYELVETLKASQDASFSTDWDADSRCFAVASQDGFVHVYDHRFTPSSTCSDTTYCGSTSLFTNPSSRRPRTVATLRTTQRGPAGAARKVKFSPGGRGRIDAGLMAFTEHRNRVHVVDARTFTTTQILEIPHGSERADPSSSYGEYDYTSTGSRPASSILQVPDFADPEQYEDGVVPIRPRPQPLSRRTRRLGDQSADEDDRTGWDLGQLFTTARTEAVDPRTRTPADSNDTVTRRVLRDAYGRGSLVDQMSQRAEEIERRMAAREAREERMARWETGGDLMEDDSDEDEDEDEEEGDIVLGRRAPPAIEVAPDGEETSGDEAESSASSVNSTRPRRFDGASSHGRLVDPDRTYASAVATLAPESPRRNFLGYAPLRTRPTATSFSSSLPRIVASSYTSFPPATATTTTTGQAVGASAYAQTSSHLPTLSLFAAPLSPPVVSFSASPAQLATTTSTPSTSSPPSRTNPIHRTIPLFSPPFPVTNNANNHTALPPVQTQAYRSNSSNFPLDTSPMDLLGLDWDEFGERLLVATEQRVWEWDVDVKARRSRAAWQYR